MRLEPVVTDDDRTISINIQIYRMFVDTAERNIDRRLQANRYFFSLVAAIFLAYAFLLEDRPKRLPGNAEISQVIATWALPLLLLIVSAAWWLAVRAFRSLSRSKYDVILGIENDLPQMPFRREWEIHETRFLTGTRVEMIVPLVFFCIAVVGLLMPAYERYGPVVRQLVGL
jgi:hypothetical protein